MTPEMSAVHCAVNCEAKLMNHHVGKAALVKWASQRMFTSQQPTWGWSEFIAWDKLIDPAEGYVKDNSVTVEMTFTPDPPTGL